ncbi:TetR family transcriptional regulator [Streptomyces durbertensis]|uniref:TetR family transcriptional regulator n=1 Tax=Streptomyces durbertensis TaxID=2448886 RepID=A0ABR6E9J4_9ACTN|nr:ScbR family autoregulator-binding transcription factor [Streptomyces durbertensis]MBB1242013.1 TetR family transcriptional regulator [Streptomyces durbertensis]
MTPKQERAVRTRERLVASAAEAFDRHGFTAASLTAISRSAGVSNGALHFHFESKEALAVAVEAAAAARVGALAEVAAGSEGPAIQALVDASHRLVRLLREDVVVRAGFRLGGDLSASVVDSLPLLWHRGVVGLLDKARREGALTAGVSPGDAAAAVVAVVVGCDVLARTDEEWLSSGVLAGFWRLLLPRLAAGPVESGQLTCGAA